MRMNAEQALTELQYSPNGMFRQVKGLKIDSKEVNGGMCMRGSYGKLCFSEKERGKVWMDYMEGIMNEENDWDCNVEVDAIEGVGVCVRIEEVLQALNEMKTGIASGLPKVSLRLIAAIGAVRIQVMADICQIHRWICNAS